MGHTGSYYKCKKCCKIYDYDDLCPDCGSDDINEISAKDINKYIKGIANMLYFHDDLENYNQLKDK